MAAETCVVFMHHDRSSATQRHFELLQANADGCRVLPVCWDAASHLPGSIKLGDVRDEFWDYLIQSRPHLHGKHYGQMSAAWYNLDVVLYKLVSTGIVTSERIIFLEWDCLVTRPIRTMYRSVWNSDLAVARVRRPQTDRDWYWFQTLDPDIATLWGDNLCGALPLAGALLSRKLVSAVSAEIATNSQMYEGLLSEVRLGTAATMQNFHIDVFTPDMPVAVTATTTSIRYPTLGFVHPVKFTRQWYGLKVLRDRIKGLVTRSIKKARSFDRTGRIILDTFVFSIPGFLSYWLLARKTIVFVASPMRSGSTLLKALLGNASDISHLPEYRPWPAPKPGSVAERIWKYGFYFRVRNLDTAPIIVLKSPKWIIYKEQYPPIPSSLPELKLLILTREPQAVVESVRKAHDGRYKGLTRTHLRYYVLKTFRDILAYRAASRGESLAVSYEALVSDPRTTTAHIMKFCGSRCEHASETYSQGSARWEWGNDDGSEKIKTMKVVKNEYISVIAPDAYLQAVESARGPADFFNAIQDLAAAQKHAGKEFCE